MSERALVFGSAADAYERYRFGYPADLADAILGYARPPIEAAVDIGAGTGKATRLFADRPIDITAVEPDPAMIEAGVRAGVWHQAGATGPENAAAGPVHAVQATLESFRTDRTFDLLFAGAAWHWTAPDTRWDRTAALLRSGGTVALFGGPTRLADPELRERYQAAQRSAGVEADVPPPGPPSTAGMQWPGTEMEADTRFTDVEQHPIERSLTVDADHYGAQLGTLSAFLMLPVDRRLELLQEIREFLPAAVVLESQLTLHLARRC